MMNGIQGVNNQGMMHQGLNIKMTDEQKVAAEEIIAKYDSGNFSEADFKAMGDAFKEVGIRPNKELKTMLEDSGFNMEQYAKGGPGMRALAKPQNMEEGLQQLLTLSEDIGDTELQSLVDQMIDKLNEGAVEEEDEQELVSYLQEKYPQLGLFMDKIV